MKGWIISVLVVTLGLQIILFYPREPTPDPKPELTLEEKTAILKEYNELLREKVDLMRKRNDTEKQIILIKSGKAWTA